MKPSPVHAHAEDLLDFIADSPSPWHAVATAVRRLVSSGYEALDETRRWSLAPGGRYFVTRGGASLIAFRIGTGALAEKGWRMVGAHTDSPGLRLKPHAAHGCEGIHRLGVEVYGGPILATFADRDLGLAGRVNVHHAGRTESRLVHVNEPIARLPNLAIHMNRDVNENGLKFNKQTELPLLFGMSGDIDADTRLRELLACQFGVAAAQIINWELAACDTQRGTFWGTEKEFLAASQLDNLASCHAALRALLAAEAGAHSSLIALFDHEEVGSESATGAAGSFLADVLARVSSQLGLDNEDTRRAHAASFFVSADMAHAWHPNFPAAYEPHHHVLVNNGPVIKVNANQRYATGADTAARFMAACSSAGVSVQQYSHRTDIGCGSTIGPIVAARLGIPTVDVGCPMWAMHSLRESAGVSDQHAMTRALTQILSD